MLKTEVAEQLKARTGSTIDELIAAHTDEKEVELTLPDGRLYTTIEIEGIQKDAGIESSRKGA